jgi:predicted DNA-binding antitoxin AbrB/MazE fold protein
MSIKVEFSNGVFKPLEKVDNVPVGAVYTVLSEDELRSLAEDLQWLKASEKSFEFWDNPEDAIYDTL